MIQIICGFLPEPAAGPRKQEDVDQASDEDIFWTIVESYVSTYDEVTF